MSFGINSPQDEFEAEVFQEIHKLKEQLAAQAAEIERLREALRPFAELADAIDNHPMSKDWRDTKRVNAGFTVDDNFTVGDLRAARRALAKE